MNDRDTFAAAALTGLIATMRDEEMAELCESAYGWADAMLRERERTTPSTPQVAPMPDPASTPQVPRMPRTPQSDRLAEWEQHGSHRWGVGVASDIYDLECRVAVLEKANHDAVPAARARTDADRNRTDKAALRPGKGAGNTPVTEPMPKEKRAEVSYAEPVAWAVFDSAGSVIHASGSRDECERGFADEEIQQGLSLAPLYTSPPQDRVVRLPPLDPNGAPGWNAAIGAVREALAEAGVDWDTE